MDGFSGEAAKLNAKKADWTDNPISGCESRRKPNGCLCVCSSQPRVTFYIRVKFRRSAPPLFLHFPTYLPTSVDRFFVFRFYFDAFPNWPNKQLRERASIRLYIFVISSPFIAYSVKIGGGSYSNTPHREQRESWVATIFKNKLFFRNLRRLLF